MDALLICDGVAKARLWINTAIRSRLGNALVILNALLLALRAIFWYPVECDHTECTFVYETIDFVVCFHPPLATVLYRLVHLPTAIAVGSIEWMLPTNWNMLCTATAFHLDTSLFLLFSCVQWLLVGAFVESWFERSRLDHEFRSRREIAPVPVTLNLFESKNDGARSVESGSVGQPRRNLDLL